MTRPVLIETLNRSDKKPLSTTFCDISAVPIPPDNPILYQLQTAGQVGTPSPTSATQEIPTSFRGQAKNAFDNVAACLAIKGATPQDITKITIYIVNYSPNLREELIDVVASFFEVAGQETRHAPPSSLVGVASLALPEFLIEVEAMAVVKA